MSISAISDSHCLEIYIHVLLNSGGQQDFIIRQKKKIEISGTGFTLNLLATESHKSDLRLREVCPSDETSGKLGCVAKILDGATFSRNVDTPRVIEDENDVHRTSNYKERYSYKCTCNYPVKI